VRKRSTRRRNLLNGTSVQAVASILDRGRPTRFRFEGMIRAGLRSYLILRHHIGWQVADDEAAYVLRQAFQSMRLSRPSWLEGQPELIRNEGRIFCANERCQKPITRASLQGLLYCCEACRRAAKSRRGYAARREEYVAYAAAQRAAKRASGPIRNCEQCGRQFQALDVAGKKPQRFCGLKCRSAYASAFAKTWRPAHLPRRRDGRFAAHPSDEDLALAG
jgi:hypothetical protein